ncbi:lipoate--protein ligase [Weissella diestrammenae]|uniref:lipoate--protein ligase n=1 Tax=Weissella diestrammenae TaxID=1162633 RepID=A0A7G9T5P4_9LACO|nr:lipoate--protein ligase [Weissella diestrammenae]MCM0582245.1 lipoate--protein ligase [Weissella diestrammenae]QNN75419.1 lipoate--protein ligase [Weissella diestrammenae]
MRFINYLGTDAYMNIAMDSWLLYNLKPREPVFALWQNKRAVIIGQNQNTFGEINHDYIEQSDIQVVRRMSGGGAVYHDLGNVCFTFFVPVEQSGQVNFKQFVQPMYDALHSLGIDAQLSGRNDLEIDGKKVSGNAQRYAGGYLMHHGTLLWDTDVEAMVRALNVADEKFISKAVKSVRARVGNIKDYVDQSQTLDDFINALKYYLTNKGQDGEYHLSDAQLADIKRWRDERFATWDWNYGRSPTFDFENHAKFQGGSVDVQANIAHGKIQAINFTGDFLGVRDWREIEKDFLDQPFEPQTIAKILTNHQDGQYFGGITNDEMASLFTGDGND